MIDTPTRDALTSQQLFHKRLCAESRWGPDEEGVLREAVPSVDPTGAAPAELVTRRTGLFSHEGLLVDPALGDVPIEAEGWFRWTCRRALIREQAAAKQFGERLSLRAYFGRPIAHP